MSSNIILNAGSGGSTLATEQNGTSEQYQKIKLVDGTAGAFTNMLAILASGAAKVDGSGVVQPVSDNGANLHVQGAAASGAAKAGNPLQVGGVFNTTQPTVTTGQAVELQATARGAQIVASGVDTFHVTVDSLPAATSPKLTYATAAAVAAGGTSGTGLRSAAITAAKTGKLTQVAISSSVAFRADIQTALAGVLTTVATLFGEAGQSVVYAPPTGYVTQAAGSAFTGFQVTATNLDIANSADQYATFYWDEQ